MKVLILALLAIPTLFASSASASARACFVRQFSDVKGISRVGAPFQPGSDENLRWAKEIDWQVATLKDGKAVVSIETLGLLLKDDGNNVVKAIVSEDGKVLAATEVDSSHGWSGQVDVFVQHGRVDVLQIYCAM